MNPGDRKRRLTVQAPVETPDGAGGVTRAFATLAVIWAQVEPFAGREGLFQERLNQRVTHRVTLRRLDGLTGAHRFRMGVRLFEIRAIRDHADLRHLICDCEEIAP